MLFEASLIKNMPLLKHGGWHLQVSGNEWQHHYAPDTHLPVNDRALHEILPVITGACFIKIAFYFSLQQWDKAEQLFSDCFADVMKALALKA
jgi:hypothetical protein